MPCMHFCAPRGHGHNAPWRVRTNVYARGDDDDGDDDVRVMPAVVLSCFSTACISTPEGNNHITGQCNLTLSRTKFLKIHLEMEWVDL